MSEIHHHIICKNCGHHFNDNFCSKCGQSANVHKIDYKYFLHDIPHSIFHVDKGFLFTLKGMFTNPGKTIKDYLAGHRIQNFRPFAFVLILSTVCTITIPLIEYLTKYLYYNKHSIDNTISFKTLFWQKYISLLIFILIPFLALVTYLSFKYKKYNYWEHFLGNAYIAALLNVMLILLKVYGLIKVMLGLNYNYNITAFMFIFMFYYSYTFKVWMWPHNGFWKLFFRLLVMNFFLSLVYITALSIAKIITPWWQF